MKNPLDVVTIDEAAAMFVATQTGELAGVEQFIKRVAGVEFSVATGLARLGLKVGWVNRVGNDNLGRFIVKSLEKEGIDAQGVTQDGRYATGFQLKSKVGNGTDPVVEYLRRGSAANHLSIEDYHETYFASTHHLHLSGVAAALSASPYEPLVHTVRTMKIQGKTILFDPDLCPVSWKSEAEMVEKLNRLAFQTDWILPGSREGMILIGQQTPEAIVDLCLRHGAKAVIVETGANDVRCETTSGEQGCVAPVKVDSVVDTVSVGDGFTVGAISTLPEGHPLYQATTRGNKIGALAIQVQGDSEGSPTCEQLGG